MFIYFIFTVPVVLILGKHYSQWLNILMRLLYRCVMFRKQGELTLPSDLVYVAGGRGVDVKYSLVISPTNHACTVDNVRINRDNLRQYKVLCGYDPEDNSVPVCYGETLFFKLLLTIVSSPKFCLAPLGLIHIHQTIKQHEPLSKYMTSDLTLSGTVKQYRKWERGVEVDIELRILVNKERCVWEGMATLFSRGKSARQDRRPPPEHQEEHYPLTDIVRVKGNCGIQYAKLSGDFNPHHLYTWSAKLLGYERPIAHGMWTLARAVAVIQETENELAYGRVRLTCSFKRPLLMPSKVNVNYDEPGALSSTGCRFRVEDQKTATPHLIGDIRLD